MLCRTVLDLLRSFLQRPFPSGQPRHAPARPASTHFYVYPPEHAALQITLTTSIRLSTNTMSSTSSSSQQTSHTTPLERILTANIYISTLQLIAALLLTLMLLWHISTVTLVENYQMPPWWVKLFMAELASGWRVGVWAVVVVLVPIECLHALLCLDWWCLLQHSREGGDGKVDSRVGGDVMSCDQKTLESISVHRDTYDRNQNNHGHRTHASTMSQLSSHTSISSATKVTLTSPAQPHTYHPLLHPYLLPRTQNILLSMLDIVMLAILAGHITSYFISLPRYLKHCAGPDVLSAPDLEFGEARVPLSMQGRCIGLNVDIHVAGGFAVFMAIVLGLLHIAALVVRIWERVHFGEEGVVGKATVEDDSTRFASKHDITPEAFDATDLVTRSNSTVSSRPRDEASEQPNSAASTTTFRDSASISAEERSTGVRFVDWSAESADHTARRREIRTDSGEMSKEGSKWGEVLLQCLIDA